MQKSRDFRFEPQVLPVSIRKSFIPKDLCLQICQIEEFEPYTKFQDNRLKNTPKNRYFVSAHAQYIFFLFADKQHVWCLYLHKFTKLHEHSLKNNGVIMILRCSNVVKYCLTLSNHVTSLKA